MRTSRFLGVLVAAVATVGTGSSLLAQSFGDDIIVVPVDSVFRGPAGSVTLIASWPVPAEFQGAECEAEVEAVNQRSTHVDNDLLVTSGGVTVEVNDVESEAFGITNARLPLTLGTSVEVSLRLGPDGVSSGGLLVTIDCPLVGPPTTDVTETTDSTEVESLPPGGVSSPPGGVSSGDQTQAPTLPVTGLDSTAWAAVAAIVLLAGGGGLVAAARRSR